MNGWIRLAVAVLVSVPATAFAGDPPVPAEPLAIEGGYTVTESGVRIDVNRLFGEFYRLTSDAEGWEGVGVLVGNRYIGVFRYLPSHEHAGATGRHTIEWSDAEHAQVHGEFESGRVGTAFEARWTRIPEREGRDLVERRMPVRPPGGHSAPPPPPAPSDPDAPPFGEYVFVEELPEAIHKVSPDLPRTGAMREGTVVVQALVRRDGTVGDARVVQSLDEDHDRAALAAARQWRFKPALVQGKPVAIWVAIPLRFFVR